ncbi:hypothetical protein [Capnocytophaga sputigena]|uniref:hypothetical protein n=1 Tax=Capnocytophaga sputigena TaxID=1019 RepID=UPI0028EEEF86|nr:hypothetical protein [Capnocytophaga sputigena]
MTPKKTLKKWFSNLMKPAQEHFAAWIDSFWHKSEQIPMSNIEGLSRAIENTASAGQLLNHINDTNAHRALFDELKNQIQAIHTILQVDDVNFDTLQEIVTLLKSNTKLQELIDKKVNKEEGKGLSSNDFTNELKSKLEGLSPFVGKFLSGNLIKGNTEFLPDSIYQSGATYNFVLEEAMTIGEYLLSYQGEPLGNKMSIKLGLQEKEVITTLLAQETTSLGQTTYYYLLKNEQDQDGIRTYDAYTNTMKVEFKGGLQVAHLQLRKFVSHPQWEAHKDANSGFGKVLPDVGAFINNGRCNLVNTYGQDKEVGISYEENAIFSVAKVGNNDHGKITFKCYKGELDGNPEITGKIGSRAEGICTEGKVYITIYNRE